MQDTNAVGAGDEFFTFLNAPAHKIKFCWV